MEVDESNRIRATGLPKKCAWCCEMFGTSHDHGLFSDNMPVKAVRFLFDGNDDLYLFVVYQHSLALEKEAKTTAKSLLELQACRQTSVQVDWSVPIQGAVAANDDTRTRNTCTHLRM